MRAVLKQKEGVFIVEYYWKKGDAKDCLLLAAIACNDKNLEDPVDRAILQGFRSAYGPAADEDATMPYIGEGKDGAPGGRFYPGESAPRNEARKAWDALASYDELANARAALRGRGAWQGRGAGRG